MPDYSTISYEEKNKKQIRKINNSELLEISCVPCPANANALIMREYKERVDKSWEAGTINGSDLKIIEEAMESVIPLDIELEEKTAKIVELENKIKQLECEIEVLSKEKEIEEDDIYKEIFDEYVGASGRISDQTDDQTDLLEEFLN
jgi:hypothetical protein